jgi:hypothetical protein
VVVPAVFAEAEASALLTGVRPLVTSALATGLLATGTLATAGRTLGDDAMLTLRVPLSATANVLLLHHKRCDYNGTHLLMDACIT